jgi:hypothetical protein
MEDKMTPAYTHWQANAIRWQANATGGGRILLSGARIMIEHRSHQTAPPLPFGILLCLLLTLVPNIRATAQDIDDEWTVTPEEIAAAWSAPLFQTDDVLELTLYADFNTIRRRDRERDAEERQASILVDAEGSEVTLDLKIRTRGNWRLNPRNCELPPLWLDFDKDDEALAGTVFEGQNRLKLYVTCRPGNDRYEEYIYTEYVIYPAYNVLTDLSFRARPVRVTYVDTSGEDDTFTSNAFLLEHKSQMAARNEAVPIELTQLHPANAHQENSALLELFNYAVGMTDYTCAGPPPAQLRADPPHDRRRVDPSLLRLRLVRDGRHSLCHPRPLATDSQRPPADLPRLLPGHRLRIDLSAFHRQAGGDALGGQKL